MDTTKQMRTSSRKKLMANQKNKLIFYILMSIIPVLHFSVFYIYIDLQSILLAFQKYKIVNGLYEITYCFDNFKVAFEQINNNWFMVKNSFLLWLIGTVIILPISLFFAYYIFKKRPLSGAFKVILFAPTIISELIVAILFKYIVNYMYPALVEMLTGQVVKGLLAIDSLNTHFLAVALFNFWTAFGIRMLMYLSAMGNINESVLEAAKLDGAKELQEFWYIILPSIYSTVTSFFVIGITGLFTAQFGLYAFFRESAGEVSTWGYYLFVQTRNSGFTTSGTGLTYSELSAIGVVVTLVIFPLVLLVRKLLDKTDPNN